MSESGEIRPRFRVRRRRWPWLVLAALVAGAGAGWLVIERLIDADRYRPVLIARIEKVTGLPAAVGNIDLSLLPIPSARIRDVQVGEGDFKASSPAVIAHFRLEQLARGQVEVNEVIIEDLSMTLPAAPGDLKQRIDALPLEPDDGPRPTTARVRVNRIVALGMKLYLSGADQPAIEGDVEMLDVLSPSIRIVADATAPLLGDGARMNGEVALHRRQGEPLDVEGTIRVTGLSTESLPGSSRVPPALAEVSAGIQRMGPQTFRFALQGRAAAADSAAEYAAVAGDFSGVAWWDQGQITMNDIEWRAPGLKANGDVTIEGNGSVAAKIQDLKASPEALQAFLTPLSTADFRLRAAADAEVSAQGLLVGYSPDHALRLAAGDVEFRGIDVLVEGEKRAFNAFQGKLTFKDDVIAISELASDGLSVQGTVRPNPETGSAAIQLKGTAEVTRERAAIFLPIEYFSEIKGKVVLDNLFATLKPGIGVPTDLAFSGKISGGALAVATDAWADRFSGVEATFTATPGAIDTNARGQSQKLGAVQASGKYLVAERRWEGSAQGDLSKMDLPFLQQEAARQVAPGILAGYGQSQFKATLTLPGNERKGFSVIFERAGSPVLAGSVAWTPIGGAWTLADVTVSATIPGPALQPMLPDNVRLSGLMPVEFARTLKDERFVARIDLTGNALAIGDYLNKREGQAARIDIRGAAPPGEWAAKEVDIVSLGETVTGRFTAERFQIDSFDISAAALASLFPEGASATGRLRGRAATQPVEADLTLDNVGIQLAPELAIDSLNGSIAYREDVLAMKGLRIRGANSDLSVDAQLRNGRWQGSVAGAQADVDALLAFQQKLQESQWTSGPSTDSGAATSSNGLNGSFDVALNTVLYKQAPLENATAHVEAANGVVEVQNLAFTSGGGTARGSIRTTPKYATAPATLSVNLQFNAMDLSVLDSMALAEPRGLRGATTGTVELSMPTGDDIPPMAGSNGAIRFTSEKGTLGTMGIATKVLAVLRTLEITRFRPPALRDEGLVFDTCTADITINNGIMTVNDITLKTPTYLIATIGAIDLNQQQTELLVHVSVLETALGLADQVPGVRDLAGMFRTAGGLRIYVTGPPDNPNVAYAWGPRVTTITDEVRRTVKTGGTIIKEEVLNRATDLLKGVLKR